MPLVTRIGSVREKTISSDESYPGVFQRSIAESAALYARDMLLSSVPRPPSVGDADITAAQEVEEFPVKNVDVRSVRTRRSIC